MNQAPLGPKARLQHYRFAHRVLPGLAHASPDKLMATLRGPAGKRFLADVWSKSGEQCEAQDRVSIMGLGYSLRTLEAGRTVALITLPVPQGATEAYYLAIVFCPPRRLLLQSPPTVRYFTLEYGASLDRTPRTVLGEWTREGVHVNMGDGPEPDAEAFLKAVSKMPCA